MRINFKTLHIEGFMSIGEADINLTEGGFILVSGVNRCAQDLAKSNGSGKSSVWESIIWCLTGDTLRGSKSVENINTQGGTLVSLDFSIDDISYKVTRTKNHEKYKTNLFFEVNGKDCSGKGIRDTEKILKEYLPEIDSGLISSVIILGQGLPARFTSNTPSGRKEMLERMSKSDYMIQELKNRVSKRRAEVDKMKRDAEDRRLSLSTTLSNVRKTVDETRAKLDSFPDVRGQQIEAETLQKRIDALKSQIDSTDVESKRNELSNINAELYKQETYFDSRIKGKFEEDDLISNLTVDLRAVDNSILFVRNEINEMKSVKDVCPTCGQKLQGVVKPDTSEKENLLHELTAQKEYIIKSLSSAQQDRSNKVNQLKNDKCKVIGELSEKAAELMQLVDSIDKQVKQWSNELRSSESQYKNVSDAILRHDSIKSMLEEVLCKNENQIPSLVENISNCEFQINKWANSLSILQKFDTVLKRDFRGILLKNVVEYIDGAVKNYGSYIFDSASLSFALDSNNISVKLNNKEYEMLSGGEKQKVDIIVQFALRDMLCNYLGFDCNILVLDEVFDNLDSVGCDKVIQLITNKINSVNSIYIISHHAEELDIPVDSYIVVEKDSTGVSFVK